MLSNLYRLNGCYTDFAKKFSLLPGWTNVLFFRTFNQTSWIFARLHQAVRHSLSPVVCRTKLLFYPPRMIRAVWILVCPSVCLSARLHACLSGNFNIACNIWSLTVFMFSMHITWVSLFVVFSCMNLTLIHRILTLWWVTGYVVSQTHCVLSWKWCDWSFFWLWQKVKSLNNLLAVEESKNRKLSYWYFDRSVVIFRKSEIFIRNFVMLSI